MPHAISVTPVPGDAGHASSAPSSDSEPASSSSSPTALDPPSPSTTSPTSGYPDESRRYVSLGQRIPKTSTVIDVIKSNLEIKIMLEYSTFFNKSETHEALFDVTFWEQVSVSTVNAIAECTTSCKKELDKMSEKYQRKKDEILDFIATSRVYNNNAEVSWQQQLEASRHRHLIAFQYIKEFQKLIRSSWGDELQSIPNQVDDELKRGFQQPVDGLFGSDARLAEHAYYVVGFLNHSGMKEKDRRTKKLDIGACIEKASSHFLAADSNQLEELKKKLPTGLVDRRIAQGGLKYPDEQFYRVFAVVECSFAKVVTPDNFMARGSLLIAEIEEALGRNNSLKDEFSNLLGEHQFSDDTIYTALRYFIKVFCNLRSKDVALKYNSNLNASNTVGLRQTLAGGLAMGKSKNKRSKKAAAGSESKYKSMRVPELKALCRERGLTVGGLKAVLIARLEEYDNNNSNDAVSEDVSGEDAEYASEEEEEDIILSEEASHEKMLAALDKIAADGDDDDNADKISTKEVVEEAIENDM